MAAGFDSSNPRKQIQLVLNEPPTGEVLLRANALLNKTQQAYGMMRLGSKEAFPVTLISEMVRQQTAFVRNEGYPSQIRRLLAGVTKPLDVEFARLEGFKLSQVVEVLYALPKLVQDRLNEDKRRRHRIFAHRNRSDMIEAFSQSNSLPKGRVLAALAPASEDLDSLRAELMTWMDTINFRLFFFDTDTFSALLPVGMPKTAARGILEKLSIELGALATHNPEYLILENPIWTRPIIHLGNGRYYFPFVSLVSHKSLKASPTMRLAYNFPMLRGRRPSKPAPYFGQRLSAFRTAKGMTQYQLADALGMKRDLVAYYERAAKNPSLEQVKRIADFFGVTVGELLNDTAPVVAAKPGPASQIAQLAARAANLPRSEQKVVIKMLEGVLRQAG